MKTELNESLIHSAYLDSDGSLYLYDKDEKDLEGWPKSWPEHIPCVQTFLKARGINYVNAPAPPTLAEIYGSKADTPPQPAHGEPWRGDSDGIYNALGERLSHHENDCGEIARTVQCVNLLAPHPDLSTVEVHSKETMDEVRELLEDFLDRVKLHGNRKETELIESALAKLNPHQG